MVVVVLLLLWRLPLPLLPLPMPLLLARCGACLGLEALAVLLSGDRCQVLFELLLIRQVARCEHFCEAKSVECAVRAARQRCDEVRELVDLAREAVGVVLFRASLGLVGKDDALGVPLGPGLGPADHRFLEHPCSETVCLVVIMAGSVAALTALGLLLLLSRCYFRATRAPSGLGFFEQRPELLHDRGVDSAGAARPDDIKEVTRVLEA